jgi:PAS domain S-box-containing protein
MTHSYNPALVAVSIILAILASLASLTLASRATAAAGRIRAMWVAGGGVAMGSGIFSMHFVGMLALRVPFPVSYGVGLIVVSALLPVVASAAALWLMARPRLTLPVMSAASLLLGGALAGMHYVGMAALHVPAHRHWDGRLVAASLVIAVVSSFVALLVGYRLRRDESSGARMTKVAAAGVMGFAIAAMHYTAMAAVRFDDAGTSLSLRTDHMLQTPGLAAAVSVATLAVLAVALVGAMMDRRMRARTEEAEAVRRSEDRFRSLVAATTQLVWTTTPDGAMTPGQGAWEAYTGMAADEYLGSGWLRAVHPDDREGVADAWRSAVAARAAFEREVRVRRHDGEWRHMLVRAVPVLEPDGGVREWVGANSDVTERRRAELAREFLAEASRLLASSLDYETTLSTVAHLAVPRLADWCAVDLLAEGGTLRRVAVAHPDPERVALAHALEARYPADPAAPHGVHAVIRTGRAEIVADIAPELIERVARDAEHLRIIRALGLRSYMVVPLATRAGVLGAISLITAESGRRYDAADLSVAEELARRAATAIDNARLFRETEESRAQLEQQAAELEETQAEMELTHDELLRANEALVARTAEAERARAAADEANQAKSAFLATMSHELRTPLNAIAGYAQLMEMGIHGEVTPAQREQLEKIRRNQTHLLGLINDVLNFARIEAGQVQFREEDVPVDETLAAVEALIEPQVAARGLAYAYRPGDPRVTFRGDRERVEQVVLNLLTNAVKFTDPGGRVELRWEASGDAVRIQVADTGHGIAPDKQAAIFEPFVQVDTSLTRVSEGTGLGLAISRDLARAMDGDLTVESEEGHGSVFTLHLRAGRPRASSSREGGDAGEMRGADAPSPATPGDASSVDASSEDAAEPPEERRRAG